MSSPIAENEVTNAIAAPVSTAEAKRPIVIPIKPGFSCTIRANTNTFYYSKAPIRLLNAQGREIAKKTFAAQGINSVVVPMKIVSSGAYEWTFSAAPEARSINVDILHGKGEKGPFEPSKVAKPIQIQKKPEDGKIHQEFYFTIVRLMILSEDWTNNTWDDAVITVVQWK
ncbi:hypothetical protein CCMSSC00406_0009645 [Pleurotus cornucopiae]|uniref:Uncharacterized protein n=1 Tax=Pleurotus cornucopiae TaxID=5321 RepID=A0ACB7JCH4_PLECO|nr:hypothetical protein CCMSSC00406_0009645 [Pleurotus cornucopiae]